MTNPLISLVSGALTPVLTQLESALTNISANPTVENAIAQGEGLVADAVSPSQLEGLSIGDVAAEAATLVADLKAKLATASAPASSASGTAD